MAVVFIYPLLILFVYNVFIRHIFMLCYYCHIAPVLSQFIAQSNEATESRIISVNLSS
jgi:hypothetical protein